MAALFYSSLEQMRQRVTSILITGTILVAVCAGIATAKPTIVIVGNLELKLDGGFKPTKLPKNKLAPIHLNVEGTINTVDGTHPPALNKVIVETDKNGTINAKGVPKCTVGKLVARETAAAEKACKPALVGAGSTNVEIQFAEQPKFIAESKLLAFNGGVKGGVTTILIHAFLKNPVSAAVVTTVKVTKIHHGPYGTKSIATIPVIAGGSGSVKEFKLELFRMFTYKGKRQGYLLAKCPTGKLQAHAEAFFSGSSTPLVGSFVRPCTPKG
jgi:hypothetical protein